MTGTPFCILPVTSLNGEKINDGKMGKITNGLLEAWSKNVGVDIVKQIKNWGKEKKPEDARVAPSPYSFK
jgi:branched-chain amino acid aminotransferase